jgi:hypothetical protein
MGRIRKTGRVGSFAERRAGDDGSRRALELQPSQIWAKRDSNRRRKDMHQATWGKSDRCRQGLQGGVALFSGGSKQSEQLADARMDSALRLHRRRLLSCSSP